MTITCIVTVFDSSYRAVITNQTDCRESGAVCNMIKVRIDCREAAHFICDKHI